MNRKKVFISWSKSQSRHVAEVLKEHLPDVLEGVQLFMSNQDIGPGERSMKVLERELDDTTYGILVVTQENQAEPWLNFEAGALSKQVGYDKAGIPLVVPLLVDIASPSNLTGPVSQFQAVPLDEHGLKRVLLSIAETVGSETRVIERRFTRVWPEIHEELAKARSRGVGEKKAERSVDSKLDEAVEIMRRLQGAIRPPGELSDPMSILSQLAASQGLHVAQIVRIYTDEITQVSVRPASTDEPFSISDFQDGITALLGNRPLIELWPHRPMPLA